MSGNHSQFNQNIRKDNYQGKNKNNYNRTKRKNSKRVLSEDFDVIVDGNVIISEKENELKDDQRFNTERHHKKQHKF